MPASWVGASVRARLLANRRLGTARIAQLAKSAGLDAALTNLLQSPYSAGLQAGMTVEAAQRQVAATLLWNLRLIAGWLPPGGAQMLQATAAWFEIANVEERLAYLSAGGHRSPYELGRLAIAWQAVEQATTAQAVHAALAASPWGAPPAPDAAAMIVWLRFRWAEWVALSVPMAAAWAAAASTLVAARTRFGGEPFAIPVMPHRLYGVPERWQDAAGIPELRAMMPRLTAWVLEGVDEPAELWRAEARWWTRVRRDAIEELVGARYGPTVVVAAVALLAHDAWLTRAALGAVERGEAGRRVFDAVA